MPPKQSYVEICLTKGQVAHVDLEDAALIEQFKWSAMWNQYTNSYYAYRQIRRNGKPTSQYMHRFLMKLDHGDKRQVDHINHDTLNNRRSNLRIVTQSENALNRKNQSKRN